MFGQFHNPERAACNKSICKGLKMGFKASNYDFFPTLAIRKDLNEEKRDYVGRIVKNRNPTDEFDHRNKC